MEKGRQIFWIGFILFVAFSCTEKDPFTGNGSGEQEETELGTIIFDFELPENRVPIENIHRIDLSIAKDAESLYSGYFLASANVSDVVRTYSFLLKEGTYYYQAGITCSSNGDTCLWDGFPGGQYGGKWTAGQIEIARGKSFTKTIKFLQ